ncbi:hypothetical protein NDI52_29955 [Leptolyngbya sp. PL-A3]|uniref:hypothetical protein n=1 Tax=Leptolyngbya sp. PL-A3 TaxID=2933911 RepID=UPI0032978674
MLRNPDPDKPLGQQLVPIAVVLVAAGALALEAPRQWERYQQRQSEVTRVANLQRSNELMEQERAIANARYEQDCLLLYENERFAQIVPNAVAVSGTNAQPLQPGLVVCDGIGGTAVVGEGGNLTQFAGNASPDVVKQAIERATTRGIVAPQVNSTTPAEG